MNFIKTKANGILDLDNIIINYNNIVIENNEIYQRIDNSVSKFSLLIRDLTIITECKIRKSLKEESSVLIQSATSDIAFAISTLPTNLLRLFLVVL